MGSRLFERVLDISPGHQDLELDGTTVGKISRSRINNKYFDGAKIIIDLMFALFSFVLHKRFWSRPDTEQYYST